MFQSWCTDVVMMITKYKAGFKVGLVKPLIFVSELHIFLDQVFRLYSLII